VEQDREGGIDASSPSPSTFAAVRVRRLPVPSDVAFIRNIRRGHYKLGVDEAATLRVPAAFDELALLI
jgi:hypothetical protein